MSPFGLLDMVTPPWERRGVHRPALSRPGPFKGGRHGRSQRQEVGGGALGRRPGRGHTRRERPHRAGHGPPEQPTHLWAPEEALYTKKASNNRFINVGEKASDADKLDGKDSTAFLASAGKAADADKLDNLDSTAFQGRVHWAHVAADGSIFAQSGGLSTVHVNTGEYYVVFPISASGKAVLATGKWVASTGTITSVILCGGAPEGATCTATGTNNTNTVYVDVKNDNGTLVDRGFYVVLFA